MKSALALRGSFGEQPAAAHPAGQPKARPASLRIVAADAQAAVEGPQLKVAIDVVSRLAEEASRIAHRGPGELSMANAFEATFGYMVEYLHHLVIGQDKPGDALSKSVMVSTELTAQDMDWLRDFARRSR